MSVVEAYAALIVRNPAKPKDVLEHAEVIKETVDKGALLARQLVALGRKTETELESANINNLLHRMVKLLTPMFPTTIVIAEDLDPRVPMIMIDPGSTHQAILNLCINARDAMPEGGKILLLTRLVPGALLRQRLVQAVANIMSASASRILAWEWKQMSGTASLNPISPPRNRAEGAASASQ